MKRVLSQFSPHDFTSFKWGTATDSLHYFTVVLLLFVFLAAELNPFYLKVCVVGFRISNSIVMNKMPISDFFRPCCGWNQIIRLLFYD